MKVSKEALWGFIFVLSLAVVMILMKKKDCDSPIILPSDKSADTAIAYLEGQIKIKDSVSEYWHNEFLKSEQREIKPEIIYVEKVKLINSGDIYFNDSLLRASLGRR